MEFPELGKNCEFEGCNQIDFLPFQCRCTKVFCREHFIAHCLSGECPLAPKPKEVNFKNEDEIFKCSQKGCKMGSLHELACSKCSKHYCIGHRFHPSCPEDREETWAAKLEEYEAPRLLHREANKISQEKITENIRKALQSSAKVKTAVKIQLMRIKQKAIGDKTQPVAKRMYFAIRKPDNSEAKPVRILTEEDDLLKIESLTIDPDLKDSVAVYINADWSLGRALDSICDLCNIKNVNNTPGSTKVKLFRSFDGYCISPVKNDILISELIEKQVLQQGDKLTVEYVDTELLKGLDENAQLFLEISEQYSKKTSV